MPTLLEYLTIVDPDLDRTKARGGPNTFNSEWDEMTEFREWPDFRYPCMMEMLENILNVDY